jgi:redox-sensitive bicupin YhaK (pirin superfamily)
MDKAILRIKPLGFPWETNDPFLFCVHHEDNYPAGNDHLGPAASLAGRNLGNDFTVKDGWRMYHGSTIPGFPAHPHCGFETVTIVRRGLVDHSDSLGAAGRFGNGDVQWMTAGKGVQHCEMFPLLNRNGDNPLELFQIWLNLPKSKKDAPPYFSMLWSDTIPKHVEVDGNGKLIEVTLIAGALADKRAPQPAPDSWAADPQNGLAIWTIKMAPGAQWTLPASPLPVNRTLYFFKGTSIMVNGEMISHYHSVALRPDQVVKLENGAEEGHFVFLQGRPINEPVVHYGPFVMNTEDEIQKVIREYQRTEFGGWPWPSHDHVHPRDRGRFARYANGVEDVKKN